MSTTEPSTHPPGPQSWAEVHASEDFQRLRSRLRRFVFPMTALFLVWYLTYVLLADYAHDFMSTKVVGNINLGLVLGLLQFVSTFVITGLYVRYANRKLDPIADRIREDMEGDAS
ncbi:DUF485 domain-containing protein [Saccharomonospora piscinae]|uniref:Clumping factor B n=1 Tax=Saccharomonospora piscinae TaxID=687388 RepID=A0A1V8ZX73_SACPI|nr:DUF485 domain-containing protein [Saccharomonospora piscinae]OQO89472.1 clumping factor B [Saccharomonospora piscinae]TLW91161.1 DUF485 domain-containing protein [Saccharomonospora piscinae]